MYPTGDEITISTRGHLSHAKVQLQLYLEGKGSTFFSQISEDAEYYSGPGD